MTNIELLWIIRLPTLTKYSFRLSTISHSFVIVIPLITKRIKKMFWHVFVNYVTKQFSELYVCHWNKLEINQNNTFSHLFKIAFPIYFDKHYSDFYLRSCHFFKILYNLVFLLQDISKPLVIHSWRAVDLWPNFTFF